MRKHCTFVRYAGPFAPGDVQLLHPPLDVVPRLGALLRRAAVGSDAHEHVPDDLADTERGRGRFWRDAVFRHQLRSEDVDIPMCQHQILVLTVCPCSPAARLCVHAVMPPARLTTRSNPRARSRLAPIADASRTGTARRSASRAGCRPADRRDSRASCACAPSMRPASHSASLRTSTSVTPLCVKRLAPDQPCRSARSCRADGRRGAHSSTTSASK